MLYYINKFFGNNRVQSIILLLISVVIATLLLSYKIDDPALNLITEKYPENLLGYFGSYISDILFQLLGISAFILPICFFVWSIHCWNLRQRMLSIRLSLMLLTIVAISTLFAKFKIEQLPADGGGVIGKITTPLIMQLGQHTYLGLIFITLILFLICLEIRFTSFWNLIIKSCKFLIPKKPLLFYSKPNFVKKAPVTNYSDNAKTYASSKPEKLVEAKLFKFPPATTVKKIENINYNELSSIPPLSLLKDANNQNIKSETSEELKQNAEKLLSVLGDFGVKGEIINISQGPVVTLYEFEPAAGTKSSRVVGLSDDIARSLSAISTRIAVIPGRNVLGIELPNKHRAFFCLKELIETPEYQDPDILLPLILGKDLAGKPYIADLAKMPHLLVAGTTGSGKSVAINAMIVSLLYRYTYTDCRLIMIDPKMLELSSYDGIPHLLTPVVTEPSKAVVALKWAVKEMENRYRLMSNLGVRNIAGYNTKILAARKDGKVLDRTVQTGFDPETGKPIYETIPISMEKLPFIVVIVDEMADLMLVAGKEIELSIQRLAQMARAAGIHIIMATQRPSVDVITGIIKANFPSRISFKVTSKIDSRTILGEQGSERLLGMGDMLYMGNSSKITRVHGPFVDDSEVEKITEYLKNTGVPEYISAVTEQVESDEGSSVNITDDATSDEALYKRAVQIVQLERKATVSYIQRCLRIGYNRAATLIEKMEQNGIVSPPNHMGKREILDEENNI